MGRRNRIVGPGFVVTPRIVVCGLGPGGQGQLTEATIAAIESIEHRYLRTAMHPTAKRVATDQTFDSLYETAGSFADVYTEIADQLVEAAGRYGEVLYAVPGSPLVLEQSVRNLRTLASRRGVELTVLPALSFLDEVWTSLQIDPVETGVRLVDGHTFAASAADQRGPLLVAHTHARWVLSDIKLSINEADCDGVASNRVIVLQRLGTDSATVSEVAWSDLDRSFKPDHLTSLFIPQLASPVGAELIQSVELMQKLRSDCPWDAEQTHGSLRRYLLEETYEVVDVLDRISKYEASDEPAPLDADTVGSELGPNHALDGPRVMQGGSVPGELYAELEEELGDLWFQILFHALLAQEEGQFDVADVARGLRRKMVKRHPHVYLSETQSGCDNRAQEPPTPMPNNESWEELKQQEKGRRSAFDDIPMALPALAKAEKVIRRARRAKLPQARSHFVDVLTAGLEQDGFDGPAELGRALLAVVAAAVDQGLDPELALRRATSAAVERARAVEAQELVDRADSPAQRWLLG